MKFSQPIATITHVPFNQTSPAFLPPGVNIVTEIWSVLTETAGINEYTIGATTVARVSITTITYWSKQPTGATTAEQWWLSHDKATTCVNAGHIQRLLTYHRP